MGSVDLTRGAIGAISEGGLEDGVKPVLQVWDVRLVQTTQSTSERYRMLLSDGVHSQQAMLATQMNDLVKSGALQKHSVVRLNEFICNVIQGRRIIIVINLDVIVSQNNPIGDPKNYENAAVSQNGPAPSSATSQPGTATMNPQMSGAPHGSGPVGQKPPIRSSLNPNPGTIPNHQPVPNNPSHVSYGNGPMSGRNLSSANVPHFKTEQNAGGYQNQNLPNPGSVGGFKPPASVYGRPAPPAYQQPSPMYTNRGPIAKNEAPARIIPIAALNPYQGRWTIRARVTSKGELRRYNNPRGEGKVFSFDLLDSDGGEIRVTCFNLVADQFYDQIDVGKVYMISRGSLKPSQKSFNHLNNDYEIFLESTSMVQPCSEDDNSIPKQQFNFRTINEIEGMDNNAMVDVIGIVTSISPAGTIMRKNGTETQKRALQLKDISGRSVELTLWGNFCNMEGQQLQEICDSGDYPVLAVKAGRVSDFSGKSIGTIGSSQLFINPDFPEAHRLRDWYNRDGKNVSSVSISRDTSALGRTDARKTVSQIKDEGLGRGEKPDWITIKATVTFIKGENFCYTACPLMVGDRQCNKKVNNNGDGTWHCDRCDRSFPECDYRYLLQFQIQDHSGMTWVTAFQESGEEIMGITAKELYLMKHEEQDDVKFAEIIRRVLFNQYLFKLKIKEEMFSDEQRIKSTVVKAEKVSPSSESRYLLNCIEKLSTEDANSFPGMQTNYSTGTGMPAGGYGSMDANSNGRYAVNNFSGNTTPQFKTEQPNQFARNDYGAGINNAFGNKGTQAFCNHCGMSGHSFVNCPRSMSRQGPSVGSSFSNGPSTTPADGGTPSSACFKCQQPGHWARDCPGANTVSAAYGSGSNRPSTTPTDGGTPTNACFKCQQPGHWARDCPGANTVSTAYGSGSNVSGRYIC